MIRWALGEGGGYMNAALAVRLQISANPGLLKLRLSNRRCQTLGIKDHSNLTSEQPRVVVQVALLVS